MTGRRPTLRSSASHELAFRTEALLLVAGMLAVTLAVVPRAAEAQRGGSGFLFREPAGGFSLRGGFARSNAGSDLFQFATQQLTLSRGDFSGFTVDADLAIRLSSRVDFMLSSSYAGSNTPSEFRDWLDENDLPIRQTTAFRRVPMTVGLRAYLLPRGQSVSRFAWIPARYAPYVGLGAGGMWYRFRQQGDFVDFANSTIFTDELQASGWTPTGNLFAGVDYNLTPSLALTAQGKYTWAQGNVSDDFQGFGRIDLSGYAATLGFYVRF